MAQRTVREMLDKLVTGQGKQYKSMKLCFFVLFHSNYFIAG